MINIHEKYIKICIHCVIYTFLVYIHIMCFHIMTQEEKNIVVSIITVECISFLLILIYSFYVDLLQYTSVYCMTVPLTSACSTCQREKV